MKSAEIARLLPEIFRANLGERSVLAALLDAMEQQHAASEAVLDELDACFDPRRSDARFVPMLARWVDLGRLFVSSATDPASPLAGEAISTGTGHLRELVASAAYLSQWRGTHRGLIAFLETATGAKGFGVDERVSDEEGQPRPFHMRVQVPVGLEAHRSLIERIVDFEKPAYVTYDIAFNKNGG